jgi:nitroimidazol reductase NimA-like FMN-containing flavoprotein (pyridoxamine 5'-phosphate oxidase superfamily)
MMFEHADNQPILLLDEDQIWRLLDSAKHGRLAVTAGGSPDIFPVNYSTAGRRLFLRTGPGTKLAELAVNPKVALEADGILSDEAWSVVVHGEARILETEAEIADARASGVAPWIPTLKDVWVEITPTSTTGRHFMLGAQPEQLDES